MHEDWALALEPMGFDGTAILNLPAEAYSSGGGRMRPIEAHLFRAFHVTPLSKVRVVMVGKDPCQEPLDASGIAFSTPPQRKPPRALINIFANLEDDPEITFARPATGDLTPWASRGALLVNAALSLSDGPASARSTLWKPFLRAVLAVVSNQSRPIPVILLGGEANDLSSAVLDQEAVISAGHPTPRNAVAVRFRLFRDAKPFSEANAYLEAHRRCAFDWQLPGGTLQAPSS